ncbi:MAG: restriction endonuclease subunit S [Ignavibacteria bacterium]|nr:restriction endonuclease subunit S [Ignavibacteria bacterium]
MNNTENIKPFYNINIPRDWKIKKFKEILIENRLGGNYENAEANIGIPVIKMGNLDRGVIKIDKVQYLPEKEEFNNEDVLKEGDLLFNTRNTLELVGKVAIWKNELPFAVYNSNLMRMKFDENLVQSNWFMNYAFNSHYGLKQLRCIATGTTSVAAIYGRDLETIKFLLPPLPEQKAIAHILGLMDTAINQNNQLIAQKELRKKWLMQKFFSYKLGIINDKLKTVKLGDVTKVNMGQSPSSESYNETGEGLPLIQGNADIKERKSIVRYWTSQITKTCEENEIIMTVRAPVGAIGIASTKSCIGRGVCSIHAEKINHIYLFYWLMNYEDKWKTYEQGSTFTAVSSKDIYNLSLIIHNSLKEQTAIAQVLQAADKEIQLLKSKTEKLREQKKGMMQVLLTGKKRLNYDSSDLYDDHDSNVNYKSDKSQESKK